MYRSERAAGSLQPLRIGVAGLGTVAGGVVALLRDNADALARRAGRPLSLVRVASRSPKPGVDLGGAAFTTDLNALHDPDIDVVVELIGGEDRALELVRRALQGGQSVVTANKAVLARHGGELLGLAQTQGAALGFEAAVAGGVPVLGALMRGLAANRVQEVAGIVNGTSNYILTAMAQHGVSFQAALSQAQAQGFAEADPTYDVEGIDAAHKLTILAALAFDMDFRFDAVYTEGISAVAKEDLSYAEELGYRLKHLAIARRVEGGVEARVHPTLVPESSLLAGVSGVMNAVWIDGEGIGPTLYYGAGAGAMPTASAVAADLIAIAHGDSMTLPTVPPSRKVAADLIAIAHGDAPACCTGAKQQPVLPIERVVSAFYLRIPSRDAPGVFAEVAAILGRYGISIEGAIQRPGAVRSGAGGASWVPIVILTAPVAEGAMAAALQQVQELPEVVGDIARIRVERRFT